MRHRRKHDGHDVGVGNMAVDVGDAQSDSDDESLPNSSELFVSFVISPPPTWTFSTYFDVKPLIINLKNGAIIFLPCDFYLSIVFFPRLISAATDWISTILLHMAWP